RPTLKQRGSGRSTGRLLDRPDRRSVSKPPRCSARVPRLHSRRGRHYMVSVDRNPASAYARLSEGSRHRSTLAVHETSPAEPLKPRLLARSRAALRTRHYSPRTEEAYVAWIRRYIFFHGKRHPAEMGAPEITRFLSSLAVDGEVAASTQNQALSALLFMYRDVLELDLACLDGL